MSDLAVAAAGEPPPLEGAFGAIKDRTTTQSVAAAIRSAILEGKVPQGSPLREARIATVMGISRAPLREALSMLAEEGLVDKIPYRGTFVASVSEESIAEIAAVRRRLEPFAVELALPHLVGSARRRITRALTEMHVAADRGDLATSIESHMAFHRTFYDLSANRIMIDMWRGWENQLQLFLSRDHRQFKDLHTLADDHEQLLDIIDTRDSQRIADAISRHVHDLGDLGGLTTSADSASSDAGLGREQS